MNKYNILIADDEKDLVKALSDRLEFEGYETIAAYEGVRAIELAHKERPDLILLDIMMPVGTGRDVLQALRSREETKVIPVIVMTALQEPGLEERMLAEGANGFLKKPFEVDHLLSEIKELLSKI